MRVLVTGARGFVGRHLVPRLSALGATPIAVDREMDVCDPRQITAAFEEHRPDAVIHLAAQSSDGRSRTEEELTFRVNYMGTLSVLRAAECCAPRARFLLVGSGAAYGPHALGIPPRRENDPLLPRSPYARSKAAADLLGGIFQKRGLSVLRLRPFNHTGPGQSDEFAVPSFARQIAASVASRQAARIRVGDLNAVRDWLHVDDVVDAYLALLDPAVPIDSYNIASGRGVSARDILHRLLELAGVEAEIEIDPARVRPADALIGDAQRLRERTGWTPRRSLNETLTAVLKDWQQRVGI